MERVIYCKEFSPPTGTEHLKGARNMNLENCITEYEELEINLRCLLENRKRKRKYVFNCQDEPSKSNVSLSNQRSIRRRRNVINNNIITFSDDEEGSYIPSSIDILNSIVNSIKKH